MVKFDLSFSTRSGAVGNTVCLLLLVFVLFSCATRHHPPFTTKPPQQRSLLAYEKRLHSAVAASPHLTMEAIGQVAYPDFQAKLHRIHFQAVPSPAYRVLVNAAIHGNEPAAAEMAAQLVEYLSKAPDIYKSMAVDIIPLVNPWGWVHDIRYNQAGIDINRDFASFKSQEARLIKALLEGRRFDLMVDLHEDPRARGFYLYHYALADKSVSEKIIGVIQDMGYPIEQDVSMIILKTENGIIDAPMWGLRYMRLTGQLSIANYYRLNNSQRVFTVETPTSMDWEDRLVMQRTALTTLFEQRPK